MPTDLCQTLPEKFLSAVDVSQHRDLTDNVADNKRLHNVHS